MDSTDSTLSHEIFETITDPDFGFGSIITDGPFTGLEIGDICAINPYVHTIGSQSYKTQLEYSNNSHACNIIP